MSASAPAAAWVEGASSRARVLRAAIVLVGIVAGQVFLFGPSLAGTKLLLPLDILAGPRVYLPDTPEYRDVVPHNTVLSDAVFSLEFMRRFAAQELRAGRLPLWTPSQYAGAPSTAGPTYSPFSLAYYLVPSPRTLAWMQLARALVAGVGALFYFRRALRVGFWPAALGASAYPVTGYFALWLLFPAADVIAWLPWVLLATDTAIRRPRGWGGPGLALTSALVCLGGQADVSAQLLVASGLYALWCLIDRFGRRVFSREALSGGVAVLAAWGLGLALASPYLLPLVEYSATGARMSDRASGVEERQPVGLSALPEALLPSIHGSTERGSHRSLEGNRLNGAAAAYAGLVAALVLAPLAFCSRQRRSVSVLWLLLGIFALGWIIDLPGVVSLLRLPGLNLLSYNRFVFVTSFATLTLAVVGLDVLRRGDLQRRGWFALPVATLAGLGLWCADRATHLPEPLASELAEKLAAGTPVFGIADLAALEQVRAGFAEAQWMGAALCAAALVAWGLVLWRPTAGSWLATLLGVVAWVELLGFADGRNPQTDPALYYPRIPVLEQLARRPPGRVLAINALPARLSESHGLHDIRGYDGVDPARLMDLLALAAGERGLRRGYARVQRFNPPLRVSSQGRVRLSPVLDMLNVRYLIFRGEPRAGVTPLLAQDDYWALENPRALPRVFIPELVRSVPDAAERLALLGKPSFDARRVAFVEQPVSVLRAERTRGAARILEELPSRIVIAAELDSPGLVVLADLWDAGWHATLDGSPVPVLRVNHALRGILAPAGESRIEFHYEPRSLTWGLGLFAAGAIALGGWSLWVRSARHSARHAFARH